MDAVRTAFAQEQELPARIAFLRAGIGVTTLYLRISGMTPSRPPRTTTPRPLLKVEESARLPLILIFLTTGIPINNLIYIPLSQHHRQHHYRLCVLNLPQRCYKPKWKWRPRWREPNLAANPDANSAEPNNLPTFTPIVTASFKWGEKDGDILIQSVDTIYNEIVHWKRNLFKTPSGKAGRLFVQEITRLLTAFSEKTALEGIAMKAAMIMPALLLQNPHQRSNSKQHSALLEHRLKLWSQGDMESLLNEGRTIQQEVNKKRGKRERQNQDVARTFAKQMMEGKVKAAM